MTGHVCLTCREYVQPGNTEAHVNSHERLEGEAMTAANLEAARKVLVAEEFDPFDYHGLHAAIAQALDVAEDRGFDAAVEEAAQIAEAARARRKTMSRTRVEIAMEIRTLARQRKEK